MCVTNKLKNLRESIINENLDIQHKNQSLAADMQKKHLDQHAPPNHNTIQNKEEMEANSSFVIFFEYPNRSHGTSGSNHKFHRMVWAKNEKAAVEKFKEQSAKEKEHETIHVLQVLKLAKNAKVKELIKVYQKKYERHAGTTGLFSKF